MPREMRYERGVPLTEEERAGGGQGAGRGNLLRNFVDAFSGPAFSQYNLPMEVGGGFTGGGNVRENLQDRDQERLRELLAQLFREQIASQRQPTPEEVYGAEARFRDPVAYANKMASLPSYAPGAQTPFNTGYFNQPSSFGFTPEQVVATRDLGSVTPEERTATRGLGAADAWKKIFKLREAATPKTYT
jgi:hypothetical protein